MSKCSTDKAFNSGFLRIWNKTQAFNLYWFLLLRLLAVLRCLITSCIFDKNSLHLSCNNTI